MAKKKSLPKLPVAKSNSAAIEYKRTKDDIIRERRWAAESGLRTLQEAETIKKDKQRMQDIKSLAKEQMQVAAKFAK